jgi:predicted nucleotidyltransferase
LPRWKSTAPGRSSYFLRPLGLVVRLELLGRVVVHVGPPNPLLACWCELRCRNRLSSSCATSLMRFLPPVAIRRRSGSRKVAHAEFAAVSRIPAPRRDARGCHVTRSFILSIEVQALDRRVIAAVGAHPSVRSVELVGSLAEGRATHRSDWDFLVDVEAFTAVANDLTALCVPLQPIAQQRDRLSSRFCWMLTLPGPTKVDPDFANEPHQLEPPWKPTRENLPAIDLHFWDWTLWLGGKEAAAREISSRRSWTSCTSTSSHRSACVRDRGRCLQR